ncbi:MAG: hypothetical protein JOZ41_03700, partial [Chloroflexi bacterium]|nr:hypothetical protein [Chloroflexota bacterium]
AYVRYPVWRGRHVDQYRWYLPNGRLYWWGKATANTSTGSFSTCNYLPISSSASRQLGTWTFEDVVDGQVAERATFAVVQSSAPGISLSSVTFYSARNFQFTSCTVSGPPATSFSTAVRRIYALVRYSTWQGRHVDQYRWYSPDGKLYWWSTPTANTSSGTLSTCNYVPVAGTAAATRTGDWTLEIVVDGRVAAVTRFGLS